MTNLAQEKKNMADHDKAMNSEHTDSCEFSNFSEEGSLQKMAYDESGMESKRHNTSLNNLSTLKPEDMLAREDWLVLGASDEEEIGAQNMTDELNDLDLDGKNDSSNETVSEAGTYTIDKDAPCPDVEQARLEIEKMVERRLNTENGIHAVGDKQEENNFTMSSSYHDSSSWISEWATQVAKHNHKSNPEKECPAGLPPLPLGKHQDGDLSQVVLTRIPSPILSPGVSQPTGCRLYLSPQHTAPINLHCPLNPLPMQETVDGHSDSSLETESFLRATESVVTAMQARMSFSLDSGGESDVDTSHSYQAPPGSTTGGGVDKHLTFRRSSVAAHSDSSSDTGGGGTDSKPKRKDLPVAAVPAPAPQMRYNRAFSLRRARLDTEEPSSAAGDSRRKKTDVAPSTVTNPANKSKKNVDPPKSAQARSTAKGKSPKPDTFSRTDCGRYSVRAPRTISQPLHAPKPAVSLKKDMNRKSGGAGGRSNSTLSSREVEFQNWKRRKSYDPMKAAAEGKKKEAAKKATMSSSMTQSSIMPSEVSSSSMQNPVLRSASFHGTAGLTPKYISSEEEEEEEVTLSADESTPMFGQPALHTAPMSPSKALLEGAFGGSRASLYSNTSNSSLRGRNKLEALDSLVMAAVSSLSNKLRGSSCNLLKKLRYLYEEDSDRAGKLSAVIEVLENSASPNSPQTKSPSKELSGTLKNLKRMENVFKVLDEVLFDEEDFDLELEDCQ
ncbi:hypothetical protein B7P43_G12373 [Cryptotermes secundus]|nr:uncharacterized protein LOC111868682 isoform X2 [Cryptotermes secundus]XP_023715334.1 uncharacterized protein LOC111868682 isoform X2 [Cryptotermes secundus]PNF25769.1 hypothetical protein B7P43_G12373 [Cryptotermes secundus]